MLKVEGLSTSIKGKTILKDVNLTVNAGEVHAIMGPNGSGKSTFAHVLAGHDSYSVDAGDVDYCGENLLALSPEQRAHAGLFLSFQYPVEIPGVTNINFLKASLNAVRKAQGKQPMDAIEFLSYIRETIKAVEMDESLLYRSVNEGFSGGEKKRNEILQMLVLEPKLAILDETDSGLDIDELKIVDEGINLLRDPKRAIILITHYQRLLNYIQPDYVHVLLDGHIVRSGDKSLAMELEEKGYAWLEQA